MKNVIVLCLGLCVLSTPAFGCQLSIPESYIPTFLNPPLRGHYQKCDDRPEEKCYCVDSVDPWISDFVEGEFKVSETKINEKLNKDNAEKAKVEAMLAKKEALKKVDFTKITKLEDLIEVVKKLVETQE